MKNLWLGLVPVVVFWVFEEKFGTLWGLIAAVVWAVGECFYEYYKNKTIEKMTLISTALVVVLGGVSIFLDKSIFFKFQPVITEIIFAVLLFWQGRKDNVWLLLMAQKSRPGAFKSEAEKKVLARLSISLQIFLIVHACLLGLVALKGSTGQWVFWKGVGFYVLFLTWFGAEFIWLKFKKRE